MSKISLKTAAKSRKTQFQQPSLHITTCDFAEISPVNILFTQPDEHYKINVGSFARMAPLAVPTFGSFKSQILSFFVPMHTISDRFEAFANRSEDASQKKVLPYFTNDQVFSYFANNFVGNITNDGELDAFHALVQRVDANQAHDFSFTLSPAEPRQFSVMPLADTGVIDGCLYYHDIDGNTESGAQLISLGVTQLLVDWRGKLASNKAFTYDTFPKSSSTYFACHQFEGSTDRRLVVHSFASSSNDHNIDPTQNLLNALKGYLNDKNLFPEEPSLATSNVTSTVSFVFVTSAPYSYYYSNGSYLVNYADAVGTGSGSGSGDGGSDDGVQTPPHVPSKPASSYYYKFTTRGRWLYKILLSLGYGINWTPDDHTELSFLPLKAFFRCIFDYIYPSAYVHKLALADSFTNDDMLSQSQAPFSDLMDKMMQLLYVPYDQDFYTQMWKNFNSVTNEDGREGVEYDVPNSSSYVSDGRDGSEDTTLTMAGSSMTAAKLSASGLRLLQAVADFVTRKNISGTRFFERAKAIFGFSYEESKHPYSKFLKSWSNNVDISDVTATTGAEYQMDGASIVQQLGEQAGKGIISGGGMTLSFDSNDYGFLVFIHRLVPNYGYYQGRKPWTLALKDPNDLFTAGFEDMGMQPVRNDELFADYTNNQDYFEGQPYGGKPDGVIGFAPRYNQFKRGFDFLTGDFRCKSRNEILKPYHMMRNIPIPARGEAVGVDGEEATETNYKRPLVLGLNFLFMRPYEFDRIFSTDSGEDYLNSSDHIISVFRFDVTSTKAMSSMGDSIPLFDKSGRDATFNYEGTQI